MTISGNVVPKITGTILRRPIPQSAKERLLGMCRHLQLADTIPTTFEESKVDILLPGHHFIRENRDTGGTVFIRIQTWMDYNREN